MNLNSNKPKDMTNGLIIVTPDELQQMIEAEVKKSYSNLNKDVSKEKYLTRKEASEKLRVSLVTMWDYSRTGKLRTFRFGKRVLYLESDIEKAVRLMNLKPKINY
jgi:hypothetical protein